MAWEWNEYSFKPTLQSVLSLSLNMDCDLQVTFTEQLAGLSWSSQTYPNNPYSIGMATSERCCQCRKSFVTVITIRLKSNLPMTFSIK